MERDYYFENNEKIQLARAYVPIQYMNRVFNPKEALAHGTLFPELYQPYKVGKGMSLGGEYNG